MLIALVGCALLFASCSFVTDFVVANQSDQAIEVRYKIRNYPGPFAPPVAPATIATSRLAAKGTKEWNELTRGQYRLDQENRTVIVQVMPGQALRIARMHHYMGHQEPGDAETFPIDEVILTGARGELKLVGQQARWMFSEISGVLYTLTYN